MHKLITFLVLINLMSGCAVHGSFAFFQPLHHVLWDDAVTVQERITFYDHAEPAASRLWEDGTLPEVQRLHVHKFRVQN